MHLLLPVCRLLPLLFLENLCRRTPLTLLNLLALMRESFGEYLVPHSSGSPPAMIWREVFDSPILLFRLKNLHHCSIYAYLRLLFNILNTIFQLLSLGLLLVLGLCTLHPFPFLSDALFCNCWVMCSFALTISRSSSFLLYFPSSSPSFFNLVHSRTPCCILRCLQLGRTQWLIRQPAT